MRKDENTSTVGNEEIHQEWEGGQDLKSLRKQERVLGVKKEEHLSWRRRKSPHEWGIGETPRGESVYQWQPRLRDVITQEGRTRKGQLKTIDR